MQGWGVPCTPQPPTVHNLQFDLMEKPNAHHDAFDVTMMHPNCKCLENQYSDKAWKELPFHNDDQDTECDAWYHLIELIDKAAAKGDKTFSPAKDLSAEEWRKIRTLPASISKLKNVVKIRFRPKTIIPPIRLQ